MPRCDSSSSRRSTIEREGVPLASVAYALLDGKASARARPPARWPPPDVVRLAVVQRGRVRAARQLPAAAGDDAGQPRRRGEVAVVARDPGCLVGPPRRSADRGSRRDVATTTCNGRAPRPRRPPRGVAARRRGSRRAAGARDDTRRRDRRGGACAADGAAVDGHRRGQSASRAGRRGRAAVAARRLRGDGQRGVAGQPMRPA